MSEGGSRKLPPLSPRKDSQDEAEEPTRRKKKKRVEGDTTGEDTPRRRVPSRSRRPTESEDDGLASPSDATPRTRRKRKTSAKSANSTARGSRDDLANVGESNVPNSDTMASSTTTKKKTKPKNVGTSRETLMNPNEDGEEGAVPKIKKKKKKKQPEPGYSNDDVEGDLGLAAELSAIRDDVVDMDDSREDVESTHWTAPNMRSEPLGTMFIEKKGGFKAADKVKLARRMEEEQRRVAQLPAEKPSKTTIQFGLATHRVFKTFTLFCHGLFAGFAFWHITMVFTMLNYPGAETFLEYYNSLAQPVQSLYYLLFVLSTVSAFDRYDVSFINKRFVVRGLTLQNGAIACFFYFAGLTVSLAIAATDDKISLFKLYPELWKEKEAMASELNTWKILNLVRGVLAILGWIVISLRPNTDRLVKNLQKADENMIGEQMDVIKNNIT